MQTVRSYTHTQATASTTWNINHNLGTMAPIIDTYIYVNSVLTKILPLSVTVTDAYNAVITFSSARSGTAACR